MGGAVIVEGDDLDAEVSDGVVVAVGTVIVLGDDGLYLSDELVQGSDRFLQGVLLSREVLIHIYGCAGHCELLIFDALQRCSTQSGVLPFLHTLGKGFILCDYFHDGLGVN